jgi:diadenosine tetraphosphate (Ap4A) HIT family hydrolase
MSACPFCKLDQARLVAECESAVAINDGFPISEGHTLVIPRRHVSSVFLLAAAELAALWVFVAEARTALMNQAGVDGINIGINDGQAAGQTIEHAHVHLIPRRHGDVPDPRGGIRHIMPAKARYWEK